METIYSDFDIRFLAHPVTKDVVMKTNVNSVKQSVKNLVLTNFFEKPFHPEIGSGIYGLLFEPMNQLTSNMIRTEIMQVITNFEPRVELIDVIVEPTYEQNHYEVTIEFVIINNQTQYTLNIILERTR